MNYPNKLSLELLLAENSEYSVVKPHLEKINLLVEGGYRLRDSLPIFVEKRPGEESDVYENRLKKYTYSNVLGSAIAQLATKFSNGSVYLDKESPKTFWDSFRENNDGKGRTENQLVASLFSNVLPYQTVFAHIDKPRSFIEPTSAAQEEALGLLPKVILYGALQVPAWSEIEGKLQWIKVFQLSEVSDDPTAKSIIKATWTFIDNQLITRYSAFVNIKDGKIANILDRQGEIIDGYSKEIEIFKEDEIAHGFNRIPVVKVSIPDAMWSGNQAYPKAEECLRLECHKHDYLSSSYPQRTYKRVQQPDSDLDKTFADTDNQPIPTGLQYVLEVDSFSWNEPTGAILTQVQSSLEQATKDIRNILAVGGAYIQEAVEASGTSKQMDFETEESRLASFGHFISDALQDIYQLVAYSMGYSVDLAVSGLDDFGNDRLEDLLAVLNTLNALDMAALEARLTPTLFLLIREKLLGFLMANMTPAQKSQIEKELTIPLVITPTVSTEENNQP